MKLVRFGARDAEIPGMVDDSGAIRDLSSHISDINASQMRRNSVAGLHLFKPRTGPLGNRFSPQLTGFWAIVNQLCRFGYSVVALLGDNAARLSIRKSCKRPDAGHALATFTPSVQNQPHEAGDLR